MDFRRVVKISFRIATAVLFFSLGTVFFTPLGGNLRLIITKPDFLLPTESSPFTFRILENQEGAKGRWLYAVDGTNYYALDDTKCVGYRFISFDDAMTLPGFDALDASTWGDSGTDPD